MKLSVLSGTMLVAADLAVQPAATRRDAALKDLMPKGLAIAESPARVVALCFTPFADVVSDHSVSWPKMSTEADQAQREQNSN